MWKAERRKAQEKCTIKNALYMGVGEESRLWGIGLVGQFFLGVKINN